MTILVVEDDALLRHSVNAILKKDGFHIIEASDGIDGYNVIQTIGNRIDLLLTDVIMPRMDGLSLAQSVTALYPRMHILLMSGHLLQDNPIRGYVVLKKPFQRYELVQAVRTAIIHVSCA